MPQMILSGGSLWQACSVILFTTCAKLGASSILHHSYICNISCIYSKDKILADKGKYQSNISLGWEKSQAIISHSSSFSPTGVPTLPLPSHGFQLHKHLSPRKNWYLITANKKPVQPPLPPSGGGTHTHVESSEAFGQVLIWFLSLLKTLFSST